MHHVKSRYFLQLVALSALWGSSFMLTRFAAPVLGPNMPACALVMGLNPLRRVARLQAPRPR